MSDFYYVDIYSRDGIVDMAKVSAEDYDRVAAKRWRKNRFGYAVSCLPRIGRYQGSISMQRFIANPTNGMHVGHINHDKMDNRRENLRVCTQRENSLNRKPTRGRHLPKGVRKSTRGQSFQSCIRVRGKYIHLGSYKTIPEAKSAYEKAAEIHFGQFCYKGK